MYIHWVHKYAWPALRRGLPYLMGCICALYFTSVRAIHIEGVAPSFSGKTLTLQAELNFITHERVTLGSTSIAEDGKFKISIDDNAAYKDIHVYYLRSGNWEGVLYAHSDGQYQIEIPTISADLVVKFDRSEMPVIWKSGTDSLHWLTLKFYQSLHRFIDEHYYDFAVEKFQGHEEQRIKLKNAKVDISPQKPVSRDSTHLVPFKHWVDHFADTTMQQFTQVFARENFLKQLRQFSIVKLQLIAGYPKTQIIRENFNQEHFPINHPAFVEAGYLCFDQFLNEGPKDFIAKNQQWIEEIQSDSLMEALMKTPLFINSSSPYVATLFFLMDQYGKQKINATVYQKWLNALSTIPNPVQSSALYLLTHRNQCKRTWICPEIQCVDSRYKTKKTSDYQGQLSYIVFFATWNAASMKELQAMEALANNFKQYVHFVAICMDDEMSGFLDYTHTHRKNKTNILYAGNHPEIREQFCLSALPHAILLSPKGLYINDYTKLPSEGIGAQIEKWLLNHGPENNNGTWKE
jgi:hypothetical protein